RRAVVRADVARVPVLFQQLGRVPERRVRVVRLTGEGQALGESPERVPPLVRFLLAGRRQRGAREGDCLLSVSGPGGVLRLVAAEVREIERFGLCAEQLLGE